MEWGALAPLFAPQLGCDEPWEEEPESYKTRRGGRYPATG